MAETIFFRLLASEDKGRALADAVDAARGGKPDTPTTYAVEPQSFRQVPGTPFAYWVSERIRRLFTELPPFESEGRTVKQGLATADDFRFVRAWWEVPAERILDAANGPDWRDVLEAFQAWCRRRTHEGKRWAPFAKGGEYSPYYADIHLVVNWEREGAEIKSNLNEKGMVRSNVWMLRETATRFFFRPGLTWPRRTQGGLSVRSLSAGSVFADKGPVAFSHIRELNTLNGIMNSPAFGALVDLQMCFGSYEVGVIQRSPLPRMFRQDKCVGKRARRAVDLLRVSDAVEETTHIFIRPALLCMCPVSLDDAAATWADQRRHAAQEVRQISSESSDAVFELFGFTDDEREAAKTGNSVETGPHVRSAEVARDAEEVSNLASQMLSYEIGCLFGRWDVHLATADRPLPDLPDPFDPLPVCPPGMLTGDDGLPARRSPPDYPLRISRDGVLVDDPGHDEDVIGRLREVMALLFKDRADDIYREAVEILDPAKQGRSDLRPWFRREFFQRHIKTYSKSRRKAPIYWELATPSHGYAVWLYYHRLTKDTFYKVLNDYVKPKLDHEQHKLDRLRAESGPEPTRSQRAEIDRQETFVAELKTFAEEIERIAPLFSPDLNDGVIVNFAPLWRLVPQHKAWQKECKKCWDKLVAGDYDWAHLAMHLWPQRVVPKCRTDASLAIAHGLEDVFWQQDEKGKWVAKNEPDEGWDAVIERLVAERTSPAVKAALKGLLEAPAPAGNGKRRKRTTRRRIRVK